MVEVPQDVGFPLPGVFEGLPPPSLANGWTLLGDLAACIFAAPFLAILSRLAGALKPEWFMHSENNGNAFIFPEASHGVMFWLCWCIGGLVMRAFEADAVDSQDLVKTVKRTALAAETSGFLANLVWLFLRFSGNLESAYTMTGYSAPPHAIPTYADFFIDLQFQVLLLVIWRFTVAVLFAERPVPEREEVNVDTRLLVGDLLAIGLITPAVIIEVYFKTKKYTPLWTDFWDVTDYGIGKPILAHGFVLALCWLVGAFVAGAYSKDATAPKLDKKQRQAANLSQFAIFGYYVLHIYSIFGLPLCKEQWTRV
ncbi:cAMP-dependent protein kinase regulatory subunit [Durusdinium trenchii]|uniref:cAMP-dependent protein kinase regulatory subunit n=1 Tax=Durusdinium trenchii TaxID=1381693 RepID=A0ABP0L242_9DINO